MMAPTTGSWMRCLRKNCSSHFRAAQLIVWIIHAINAAVFIGSGKLPQSRIEIEQARNAFDFQSQYKSTSHKNTINLMGRHLFLNEQVVDEIMR
ncbi:hypothetical protein BB777_05840 [Planococcus faecalis]|nr:hypothetical protein BB777_05840 [Planococcus faecalis]